MRVVLGADPIGLRSGDCASCISALVFPHLYSRANHSRLPFMSIDFGFNHGRLRGLALAAFFAAAWLATGLAHAADFRTLEIATRSGVRVFSVEMATTEEEKRTGLM